jgi:inhibitor of the pro-sigma K processing machinery
VRNKIVSRIVVNGLLGAAALILINLVGAALGFHLAFNIVSVYVAGFLGVPGIVLLVVLKKYF